MPFYIAYQVEKICNTCRNLKNLPDSCKLEMETKHLDLTQYFTKIFLEKNKDTFIADILLATNNDDECILVEFAVTHRCEENKIQSGLRIIEFQIENEGQLDFIETLQISEKEDFCHFFNFNPKKNERNFFSLESCNLNFETFIIYRTGKAIKKKMSALEIANQIKLSNYLYLNNLDLSEDREKNFSSLVEESSRNGIEVKNCFACRFFTYNKNFDQIHPYWCKKHKAEVKNSNDGVGCNKFWRIPKFTESQNPTRFQKTKDKLKITEETEKINECNNQIYFISPIKYTLVDIGEYQNKGFEVFSYRFDDIEPKINCPMNSKLIDHSLCESCAFSGPSVENKIICCFNNKIKD